jgi:hypothetical protein
MVLNILTLLAIYGVCFALKDTKGLSVPRNWIRRHSVIIDSMLDCPFCTGFWSGLISYGLWFVKFDFRELSLFCFGGAALCYIIDTIMILLESSNE